MNMTTLLQNLSKDSGGQLATSPTLLVTKDRLITRPLTLLCSGLRNLATLFLPSGFPEFLT